MQRDISRFEKGEYDLIVVGGGINGAAIANIAAASGLKVALLEKKDFASGTSSKSTKLIHGGIRYLEHFEFDLVHESLKERFIQLKSVPHLVKPVPFIIPVYKNDKRPLWMMKLGVWLYDFLSTKFAIGQHRNLTTEELLKLEPSLKKENLLGGVMYYDAQMDDARLCLENVLSAAQKGAHVANYVEVEGLLKENGKIVGVEARDWLGKKTLKIRARKTICAVGPWTNELLKSDHPASRRKVRLTKGIHIVYAGKLTSHALLLTSHRDRRIFFVIPFPFIELPSSEQKKKLNKGMGNSLIGTTDTDYVGNPDDVKATPEDIEYLLTEARWFFPTIDFKEENIITTFAGLRPLFLRRRRRGGLPSDVSRKHVVVESFSGLFLVIGGKYTTYRKIAVDCVNRVLKSLKGTTVDSPVVVEYYPLYGSGEICETPQSVADRFAVPVLTVEYLMQKYGTRYIDVLQLTENRPELKHPICNCSPAIAAQVVYSLQIEMAQTPEDIIDRRLGLAYLDCSSKQCEKFIRDYFLSW